MIRNAFVAALLPHTIFFVPFLFQNQIIAFILVDDDDDDDEAGMVGKLKGQIFHDIKS